MKNQIYDTIIIGSGPAGITAGIYAIRREMKTLVIGKEPGGQVVWASEIENYPGFRKINNIDLITKWNDHAKDLGVEFKTEEIQKIEKSNNGFIVYASKEKYQAKTVIIAMGLVPRRLAIPGEQEFIGKGISYCANCDSPFYRDKQVAVVGGGNAALDAAEILSKIASQVYLIHRRDEFRGFEVLVDEVKLKKNIKLMLNSEIKEIKGDGQVQAITVVNKEKKEQEIKIDGVFIEVGRIAHTDLVADLVERTKQHQIIVDDKCGTKTPGLFAAGDVTTTPYKQITIAMGQGTIAALAAYEFIQLKKGKEPGIIMDRSVKPC
ncbi:thioredoxin-disulfide reductase [Candidatus Parcubacteria bacterium]|nr:thioredoxin-disulfide reductase [Candidatus Parcubacteria bacterium]